LLATSGDVFRLWEMGEGGAGGYDGQGSGYVGRGWSNGQGGGGGCSLNPRAVLTNVGGLVKEGRKLTLVE
jgi:hypothetical protein